MKRVNLRLRTLVAIGMFMGTAHLAPFAHAAQAIVEMSTEGEQNHVVFTVASSALDTPLRFVSPEAASEGGIYFETRQGRSFLRGRPTHRQAAPNGSFVKGRWELEGGRTVTVAFTPDGPNLTVECSAEPDEDILGWGFSLAATDEEYYTGLFERTVDGPQERSWDEGIDTAMNLRGQKVDMIVKPTLSMYAPFFLSSRGYGVFVHGTWPGVYDLCATYPNAVQVHHEGPSLSFRLYTADHPADLVKIHAQEAGPSILPPKWTFTPWRWRDEHDHREKYFDGTPVKAPYNSELVEDVLMMEALDIPCGLYWVDRPWAIGPYGYSDFIWDEERMPNAVEMIDWLDGRGMKFMLWIAPWVMGDMAQTALEKGYNLEGQQRRIDKGEDARILIDFTNPLAVNWWKENGPGKVLRQGVKGFKLDRGEELVPESREETAWDGRTIRELRNDYPVEYVRATYEIAREIHGPDMLMMPRAGYTGSQRYGAFWGGDIGSPPEGLRTAIIAQLRCAVMGYPIWGSDTGGYWQGDLDREVFARWLAFSCFSPIMEVGPTENRAPWSMKKEPHYDSELIATWRLYAHIHNNLVDYSHAAAEAAHETGMPIVRPLWLVYPDQRDAWQDWQTFLYGDDILVSALWRKHKRDHRLYLPAGEEWIDAWNPGKVYEGGRYVAVDAPMHKIPIFLREGADVDLGIDDLQAFYEESLALAHQRPDMAELQQKAGF